MAMTKRVGYETFRELMGGENQQGSIRAYGFRAEILKLSRGFRECTLQQMSLFELRGGGESRNLSGTAGII